MTTGTTSPIEALRAAVKGKTFDEKCARSEIETAIGRYRAEYRATDAELEPLRQVLALPHIACRKPVAEGKVHLAKMRRHIAKLRKDVVALLSLEHRNTLFVVGGLYEEKKWSNDFGMMTVAGELRELIRTLDHIDNRIQAFTSKRLPSSLKGNHVKMLTLELAKVYREYTGREPASGSHGTDERDRSPFVLFLREVLHQCAPKEAKREALGQSVYTWLREDKATHRIPA